jgi:hypothetical protein
VRIGRRPLFFLATALVCLVLLPASPPEFRWVNLGCAGLATFWAVLLAVEELAADRRARSRRDPPG